MGYVHAINFVIKVENISMCLATAQHVMPAPATPGAPVKAFDWTNFFWGFGYILIMSVILNALLVVGAELSMPFNKDSLSFPGIHYEKRVDEDAQSIMTLARYKTWDSNFHKDEKVP